MKKVLIMPVLAAVLFAAGCSDDDDPIAIDTSASVRFFNATSGITGNGGFTTNGQFATGSAVAFGQSSQTCSKVDAGTTAFGFGTANTGGTSLSANALATLSNQSITAGGNYILMATGSAASPQLYLIENTFAGTLPNNQAAVRFVNLAPGPSASPNNFAVFSGVFGLDAAFIAQNFAAGEPTLFRTFTSGPQKFSMLRNHEEPPAIPDVTFNLQGSTAYTIAIIPNGSVGFQMVPIPRC